MKKPLNQKTGNPAVDLLMDYSIQGDIIPPKSYKLIKKETGTTDMLGVQILANIIYWHRPTPVVEKGSVIGYKTKFYGQALQKSYDDYAEMYDVTKRQVKASFDNLESLGFIKRTFKTVTLSNGLKLSNVMFIELLTDKLSLLFDEKPYVKDDESFAESFVAGIISEDEADFEEPTSSTTSTSKKEYDHQFYVTPPTKKCKINTYNNTNNKTYTKIHSFIPNTEIEERPDRMNDETIYREILSENVELDSLLINNPGNTEEYLEYFEIMVDLVCHNKSPIKSHGQLYSSEIVKSRMLKLRREHLEHVFWVYKNYVGDITDFYKHCAATLYNSYFEANNKTVCEGNTTLYNLQVS